MKNTWIQLILLSFLFKLGVQAAGSASRQPEKMDPQPTAPNEIFFIDRLYAHLAQGKGPEFTRSLTKEWGLFIGISADDTQDAPDLQTKNYLKSLDIQVTLLAQALRNRVGDVPDQTKAAICKDLGQLTKALTQLRVETATLLPHLHELGCVQVTAIADQGARPNG